jgi:hypothetical protein
MRDVCSVNGEAHELVFGEDRDQWIRRSPLAQNGIDSLAHRDLESVLSDLRSGEIDYRVHFETLAQRARDLNAFDHEPVNGCFALTFDE